MLYAFIIANDGTFIVDPLFLGNVRIGARLNRVRMNRSWLFFIVVFGRFMIFHIVIVRFAVFVVMSFKSTVLNFN